MRTKSVETKFKDAFGDDVTITTDVGDVPVDGGALARLSVQDRTQDDPEEAVALLNRDNLVALRSAIDSILTADDARRALIQSPPGTSPSTT